MTPEGKNKKGGGEKQKKKSDGIAKKTECLPGRQNWRRNRAEKI